MDHLEGMERRSKAKREERFRGTVALQIYLPMAAAVMALVALAAGMWKSSTGSPSVWADIALIMLLLPLLVFILLAAAAVIALIVGLARFARWVRIGAVRAGAFVDRIGLAVKRTADGAVQPILVVHGIGAVMQSAGQLLGSLFRAR